MVALMHPLYNSSPAVCIHSESSILELQSRVAPSVEYDTTNMVQKQEAIPEEGGWKKHWLSLS